MQYIFSRLCRRVRFGWYKATTAFSDPVIRAFEVGGASAGAETGFRKGGGGGPGNCSVLKRGVFAHMRETFFPSL